MESPKAQSHGLKKGHGLGFKDNSLALASNVMSLALEVKSLAMSSKVKSSTLEVMWVEVICFSAKCVLINKE